MIGRSALDGFYYPGIVSRCLNSRYLEVDFDNGDRQVTSVRNVIPVGGARPCPTLKVVIFQSSQNTTSYKSCCWWEYLFQSLCLNVDTFPCYAILIPCGCCYQN